MSAVLSPPPSLLKPAMPAWAAVLIACIASFMVVMDGAIVNVALPAMQADLGLSAAAQQWVVDAYLLTLGGFMLLAARAGDLFGRRRVLQTGLLVFTLASLAGGMAASATQLLAARAVQGLGASTLATSTLAVIAAVHPGGPARGRAISLWAASSAIASACGVLIGGLLTSQFGWRWVMYVNVPIGGVLLLAVALCLAPAPVRVARPRLDLPGALCATLAAFALMLGISQSVSLGWTSLPVLALLAAAAALIAAFCLIEARTPQPLIRLSIFGLRNVRIGNAVVMGLGASLTAASYFVSLLLQRIAGFDALHTGLAMLPMTGTLAVAAIVSRPLMDAGVRRLPCWGGLISAAGLLWLGTVPAGLRFVPDVLGPTLLIGLGLGLMLMTATHTALDGLPASDVGLASGLFNSARQLGAALGIAGLSTLSHAVTGSGAPTLQGCQAVFAATAALSALAGLLSLGLLRPARSPAG